MFGLGVKAMHCAWNVHANVVEGHATLSSRFMER